jgi:thiol-disulfide isomerase/thioredoxin
VKLALTILILLASKLPSGAGALAEATHDKLVKLDPASGELRPYEIPAAGEPEYFMIYFSAHWCPPCRKMTPALVEFYNETKAAHPGFEFILVSGDRDQGGMGRYMRWAQMPWPALAWDQRESVAEIAALDPRAIPFMAMLDKDGQLLGASDLGGFNVGIAKLLSGLQAKLGSEVYDFEERHGKESPLVLAAYALAALALAITLVRKVLRARHPKPD